MVESTLKLRLQYGVELKPEDDPIECVIQETHDFMYDYIHWIEQIEAAGASLDFVHGIDYHNSVRQSIFELEMLGWQHEPLPEIYPELDTWLTYLP